MDKQEIKTAKTLESELMEAKDQKETKYAVIYVRTATSGGYGIENQTETCKTFAEKEGFHVIKVFADDGKSANSLNRPAFNEMLEYCKNYKNEVNAVIVWRYDRLTRSMLDYQRTIIPFLKQNNIKLLSATEPNEDTPEARLYRNIMLCLNSFKEDCCKQSATSSLKKEYLQLVMQGIYPF